MVLTPKTKFGLLAACILAVAVSIVCVSSLEKDPTYNGHKLSQLVVMCDRYYGSSFPPERQMASEGINKLGTNVIPILVNWLRTEDPSPLRLRLMDAEWKLGRKCIFGANVRRRNAAVHAFNALGTNADYAVPPLTQLLFDTNNTKLAHRAAYALGNIQRQSAVRPLVLVLTSTNMPAELREVVADALQYHGTNDATAIPALVQCLKDHDPEVARKAASTLGALRLSPDLVVPALVRMTNRDGLSQTWALYALGEFGKRASNATAAVMVALNSPNAGIRAYATNALREIAPELLTNTPPQ